ncbi:EF-hand domain-containing family member C2-like [Hermetia illucens]|nr:EF-hand domain-containing family member C2-like [Hermetia illucens]
MLAEDRPLDYRGKVVEGFTKIYPPGREPKYPGWLSFDKQMLTFHAYFKESLEEVNQAPYQVRHVKIYYFLEDDTVQVVEPQVLNSGIPQGCLVSRQRIPHAAPCTNDFITLLDLNVDKTVRIYDRVYHITGCDKFTRHFLNRAGISVPDEIPSPLDPFTEMRKRKLTGAHAKKPNRVEDTLGQFLAYDRQILKFDAYWNDRSEFGELRKLQLYYYLADDTIEIKEIYAPNSGRDGPAVFLKRSLLPKEWIGLPQPGGDAQPTILNVLGGGLRGGRFMIDGLDMNNRKENCYRDNDLVIGAHINVYGRDVVLVDCDAFTKNYYRKKYGIELFNPVPYPQNFKKECIDTSQRDLPPFNGWGSHIDSEGNCKTVEPKAPQFDFKKFFKYDRCVLRFGAKMISPIPENCDRVFIISYYLADDTLSIFELASRNSGFYGGEFFKRDTFYLPDQEWFTSKRPEIYKAHHFYIGAMRRLRDHLFRIVTADEFTLLYMENHPANFPLSDVKTILKKIRETLQTNYKEFIRKKMEGVCTMDLDGQKVSLICFDNVRNALIELLGERITEQEIISLCRHFSAEEKHPPSCKRERVRSAAQLAIKRDLWDSLDRFKELIYHFDPAKRGFLPENRVRSIILGCRLPFTPEMIDNIMDVLNRNSDCEIELCDLINMIDVSNNPAPAIAPVNVAFELCPNIPFSMSGRMVIWDRLIEGIGLEKSMMETE